MPEEIFAGIAMGVGLKVAVMEVGLTAAGMGEGLPAAELRTWLWVGLTAESWLSDTLGVELTAESWLSDTLGVGLTAESWLSDVLGVGLTAESWLSDVLGMGLTAESWLNDTLGVGLNDFASSAYFPVGDCALTSSLEPLLPSREASDVEYHWLEALSSSSLTGCMPLPD